MIGNLLLYAKKPVKDVESELSVKYGSLVGIMEGSSPVLIVADAAIIDQIFIKNFSVFSDIKNYYFHPIIVQGVLTANGGDWRRSRKITRPGFISSRLRPLIPGIESCLSRLEKHLNQQMGGSKVMDMNTVMETYMIDIVAKVLFGIDSETYQQGNQFVRMAREAIKIPFWRITALLFLPESVLRFFQLNLTPHQPTRYFLNLLTMLMRERKQHSSAMKTNEFVDVLIDCKSQKGSKLSDEEIIGNMFQFFIAGMETTSGTLSTACHALAVHPDAQEKLREEVLREHREPGKGVKDSYLDAFMQEVLRLYPHAVRIDRVATSSVRLSVGGKDVMIDAGTKVRLPIYHMNHHPDLFHDPEVFDPERFLPGGRSYGQRIYTFAAGPRNCIGENFARLVIRITLSHLVENYEIKRSLLTTEQLDFSRSHLLLCPESNFITIEKRQP